MIFFRKVEDRKTQFSIDNETDSSIFTNISEDLIDIMWNTWFFVWTERFIMKIFWSKEQWREYFLKRKKKYSYLKNPNKESYQ